MQYPITLKMADGTDKQFWLSDEKLQFGGETVLPIASNTQVGGAKIDGGFGVSIRADGILNIARASNTELDQKTNYYKPVTPANLEYAVRAGLLSNAVITDADKPAICQTIGAEQAQDVFTAYIDTSDTTETTKFRHTFERPIRLARVVFDSTDFLADGNANFVQYVGMCSSAKSSNRGLVMEVNATVTSTRPYSAFNYVGYGPSGFMISGTTGNINAPVAVAGAATPGYTGMTVADLTKYDVNTLDIDLIRPKNRVSIYVAY